MEEHGMTMQEAMDIIYGSHTYEKLENRGFGFGFDDGDDADGFGGGSFAGTSGKDVDFESGTGLFDFGER